MQNIIFYLQVVSSTLFFFNKVYFLLEKKSGWTTGLLAAIVALFYFWNINMYIYVVLEISLILIMSYELFIQKNERFENGVRILAGIAMSVILIAVFTGFLRILEFISCSGILIGTYLFLQKKPFWCWVVYLIAHVAGATLGYKAGQIYFACFQIASAIIAVVGIDIYYKKKPSPV